MDVPSTENGVFLKKNLKGTFEELVRSVSNDVFEGTLSYEFSRTLHEMEVITKTQEKECASINDNLRRNEFLYDIIFKRNLDLESKCIVALEQSGNDHIIEKLREKIDPSFISSKSGELENPLVKPGSTKAPKQGILQILDPSVVSLSNTASKIISQPIQDQQHETSVEIEEEAKLVPHYWPSTRKKNKNCFTDMVNIASLLAMLILLLGVLSLMITAFAQESQNDQLPQLQTNAGLRPTKQPKIDNKKTKSPPRNQPNTFPLTINSPRTPFPKKLGSTSTHLNLTISSNMKYNWEHWKIQNGNKVHTLTLLGCFNESDINYFLVKMQKLTALFLLDNKCLCQEFSGKTSENKTAQPVVVVHNNLKHLHISAFSECELLYKYMEFGIYFPKLKSVTLKRPYVASTNVKHFDSFIWKHRFSLTKIQLIRGTLCETCELFSRRSNRKVFLLGKLKIAKLSFSDSNSTAAIKTLRNLSHASPGLSQFQTNASCAAVDIRILQEFWKHLDKGKSQLCQVR